MSRIQRIAVLIIRRHASRGCDHRVRRLRLLRYYPIRRQLAAVMMLMLVLMMMELHGMVHRRMWYGGERHVGRSEGLLGLVRVYM